MNALARLVLSAWLVGVVIIATGTFGTEPFYGLPALVRWAVNAFCAAGIIADMWRRA